MGQTHPYSHLTPHLPSGALISLPVLISVFGSVILQFLFQLAIFFRIRQQDYYQPPEAFAGDDDDQDY